MNLSPDVLKQDLRKSIDELKKLGSGIRADLRTAGVDARKQWKHFLEPQIAGVEKLARDVQRASHDAVARTSAAFNAFRSSLEAPVKVPRAAKGTRKSARAKARVVRAKRAN